MQGSVVKNLPVQEMQVRALEETRVATREESAVLGLPSRRGLMDNVAPPPGATSGWREPPQAQGIPSPVNLPNPGGVAFQAPPGSQASSRGEAKDSALLSSRDAGLFRDFTIF